MNISIEHGSEVRNSVREHKNAELFRLIRTTARVEIVFDAIILDPFTGKRTHPMIRVSAADEKACRATARIKLRAMYEGKKITKLSVRSMRYLLDSEGKPISTSLRNEN